MPLKFKKLWANMKLYALYRIHCIKTNMDYIGWSINPINRVFKQHEKNDSYIGNAIRLYGWDIFDVDVLYLVKTKGEVLKLEIEEITKHNCQAPNGYNLTAGGEGGATFSGRHHTEKWKQNKSEEMQGKKYAQGRHHTKEAIEKMKGNKNAQGYKHTKKELEKMKLNGKGKKKPGTSAAMKGKKYAQGYKHTKEELKKMKKFHKHSIAYLKKVIKKLEQELEQELN